MKKHTRRDTNVFSLSFLDVISCGFGAVILLFVLMVGVHPVILEEEEVELEELVKERENAIYEIRGETTIANFDLRDLQRELSEVKDKLARLRDSLSTVQGEFAATESKSILQVEEEEALLEALQRLDLDRIPEQSPDALVAGIPADSNYVIFVIDTSGSMREYYALVRQKLRETLSVFPELKGIQLMNADGDYLFPGTVRQWLEDSPEQRDRLVSAFNRWGNVSNSNPGPGIVRAIKDFYQEERDISIFVLGDEMATSDADAFLALVDRNNPRDDDGRRLVRIHAMGFPTGALQWESGKVFSDTMRLLSQEHDGAFVGITR